MSSAAGPSGAKVKAGSTPKKNPGESITLRMNIYHVPKREQPPVISKKVVIHIPASREVAQEQNRPTLRHPSHSVFVIELRFESLKIDGLSKDKEEQLRMLLSIKTMRYEIATEKDNQSTYAITLGGVALHEIRADSETHLLAAAEQRLHDELTHRLTRYVRDFGGIRAGVLCRKPWFVE